MCHPAANCNSFSLEVALDPSRPKPSGPNAIHRLLVLNSCEFIPKVENGFWVFHSPIDEFTVIRFHFGLSFGPIHQSNDGWNENYRQHEGHPKVGQQVKHEVTDRLVDLNKGEIPRLDSLQDSLKGNS